MMYRIEWQALHRVEQCRTYREVRRRIREVYPRAVIEARWHRLTEYLQSRYVTDGHPHTSLSVVKPVARVFKRRERRLWRTAR